eukprot:scaffold62616_cov37-Phaeocystis_antarctica.AAC.1
MRQTSDRRQACGASHHGGGGLGQPPADAIEASALRARPRWRGATRLTPATSFEPSSIFSAKSLHDSGDSVARLGDDRQTGPDFLGAPSDASSFAVGGKGLASAAGAADARKKTTGDIRGGF